MESFNENEPFDIIGSVSANAGRVLDNYKSIYGAPLQDSDVQVTEALRSCYPKHLITAILAQNCDLLAYAAAGYASAEIDPVTDTAVRWRGYLFPSQRGQPGRLGDAIRFAKYRYKWLSEEFILYKAVVRVDKNYPITVYYVLRELDNDDTTDSRSKMTDNLIQSVGDWQMADDKLVYVYDNYWTISRALWEEVQKADWDDVILDQGMKTALQDLVRRFFDSKKVYEEAGVPWKRGVIFHGPAGNGKTISLKAIMHTLSVRKDPIPSLYIKAADFTYNIRQIFAFARQMAPCLVIFEDIDTIVTDKTRSYFFNEADGLEHNDGIMMIASTNHLDRLDPGLSHRPSRFDRKYLFPQPSLEERTLYCEFWRHKLRNKPSIEFPEMLCKAMAGIMGEFSFAYMKEAFIATLLTIAGSRTGKLEDGSTVVEKVTPVEHVRLSPLEGRNQTEPPNPKAILVEGKAKFDHYPEQPREDDPEKYEIWRVMVTQVKILRDDMAGEVSARRVRQPASRRPESFDHAGPSASDENLQARMGPPGWRNGAQPSPDMRYRGREAQSRAVRGAGPFLQSAASVGGVQFVPDA
ncbi:hypothetical protein MMC26_001725 [Xylographa opegraphella]|nr:hypothetical protein [Xylographa opegraphella]